MTYDKPIDTPQPVAGVSITDTIREALEGHIPTPATGTTNSPDAHMRYCTCGHIVTVAYTELDDDEVSTEPRLNAKLAAHQTEAVAAALTNGGHVEYGVRHETGVEKYASKLVNYSGPGCAVSRVVGPWVRAE